MKKALIFALLSFGMVLGGVSHAKEYKSMTVRIACSTPPGSVQAVPLARLAEIVHKESNGKIKCELYTGGVLGDEQAVVKQLRSNEIQ
ncbi:MAG: C4-dicarboxylate ABC transporter substrate-binding protein, partial [Bilophila wadsworthia]